MCGRFVSAGSPDRVAAYFDAVLPTEVVAESLGENYNVAPTQDIYAVVGTAERSPASTHSTGVSCRVGPRIARSARR